MDRDKIVDAVAERATQSDGRRILSCADALMLAAELGLSAAEIGRICNEQGIRISNCQLGCFK